jgi:hypothetical protein
MRLKSLEMIAATFAITACVPPIEQRAADVQIQYGEVLARHFYAVGKEVKCELDAEALRQDSEIVCADLTNNVLKSEDAIRQFQERYPEETIYLEEHCEGKPMLVPGFPPAFALDCRGSDELEEGVRT